jgi:hypothetical protein
VVTAETDELTNYQLRYPTFHLKDFSLVEKAVGLYGETYRSIIKATWYILYSQPIREVIVHLGDVKTDCRCNSIFVLPSGYGKKHIEVVIENTCEKLGERVSKPTSYHPEQLVGKTNRCDKKGEETSYEQVRGHLDDDMVIFDDATELVRGNEPLYRESRRYIIEALDPIGDNLVTKRLTGIPREQSLKYCPHCTIILFLQPYRLPEEVFLSGLFRRYFIHYKEFEDRNLGEEFSQKVKGQYGDRNEAISCIISHLKSLKDGSKATDFNFAPGVEGVFNKLHLSLVEFGKSFGTKASNFTESISFPLQNWLLKMAVILANSQGKKQVGAFEIEMAFVDLLEFLNSTFNFVEKKVIGSLDYGESWKGATGKDLEILQWLSDRGASSEENSTISISGYIEKISEVFNIGRDAARKKYRRHQKLEWIESKQTGSQNTVVYLKFKPILKDVGGKGDRVIREYSRIIEKYTLNDIQIPPSITHTLISPIAPTYDFNKLEDNDKHENRLSISSTTNDLISPLTPLPPYHPVSPTDERQEELTRGGKLQTVIAESNQRIEKVWKPKTMSWVEVNKPGEWRKMKKLEEEINDLALRGNMDGLREKLSEREELVAQLVTAFEYLTGRSHV